MATHFDPLCIFIAQLNDGLDTYIEPLVYFAAQLNECGLRLANQLNLFYFASVEFSISANAIGGNKGGSCCFFTPRSVLEG